jgi:hypothetical protein
MNRNHNWKLIELFIYVAIVVISIAVLITTNWDSGKNETESPNFGGESHVVVSGNQP